MKLAPELLALERAARRADRLIARMQRTIEWLRAAERVHALARLSPVLSNLMAEAWVSKSWTADVLAPPVRRRRVRARYPYGDRGKRTRTRLGFVKITDPKTKRAHA